MHSRVAACEAGSKIRLSRKPIYVAELFGEIVYPVDRDFILWLPARGRVNTGNR